jgi:hypothetical protein
MQGGIVDEGWKPRCVYFVNPALLRQGKFGKFLWNGTGNSRESGADHVAFDY